MLTPEEIQGIANDLTSIYSKVEDECVSAIAKAISSGTRIKSTQMWQLAKLSEIGALKQELYSKISDASKKSLEEVKTLVAEALSQSAYNDTVVFQSLDKYKGMSRAKILASIQESEGFLRILSATINGVKDSLNLTGTKALQGSVVAYTKAVNKAYLAMSSGNMTRQQAVQEALLDIGKSGITIVDNKKKVKDSELVSQKGEVFTTYKNGDKIRVYPLDSAIRRDLVTQINKASAEVCLTDCEELGTKLVETSWHNGARPEHEVWQGKVFSLDPKDEKYPYFYASQDAGCPEYGSITGICGINCRHSFSPYVEGSPLRTQEGKLSREENNKQYANEQKQRAYERKLRALKREKLILDKVEDSDSAKQIQSKITAKSAEYRKFLKEAGLTRNSLLERVNISKSVKGFQGYESTDILRKTPTTKMLDYIDSHSRSSLFTPQTAKEYKAFTEKDFHVSSNFTPNGIIDRKNIYKGKESVDRYYYSSKGKLYKDISNNSHGEKKTRGKNGEHAHDWIWRNGKSKRFERDLTDKEKEECKDILI